MQDIMSFITEMLSDPEKISDMQEMMKRAVEMFGKVAENLKTASQGERMAFVKELDRVTNNLGAEMLNACQSSGVSKDMLKGLLSNMSAGEGSDGQADEMMAGFKVMIEEKAVEYAAEEKERENKEEKTTRKKKWISI